jgi:hypothetical protein
MSIEVNIITSPETKVMIGDQPVTKVEIRGIFGAPVTNVITGLTLDPVANYAAIDFGDNTQRLIYVAADELNGDSKTLYFHDGTELIQLFTV